MNITSAKYNSFEDKNVSIQAIIDGSEMSVPLDPDNRHYAEILKQVKEGLKKGDVYESQLEDLSKIAQKSGFEVYYFLIVPP